ncbi:EamA domain-containing membrane protein RarD [Rhizobium azibense]|uniref:EamA domain-containing membrane protein RarD n=1 Tax=Rhizobium azibense TaxID=1136135 RepID=A0A4R3QJW7_9HYPH|nr:DMT family transporter [Rhizobium azibense]TCU21257.1 EamA domain-containing membrane protein RarD [Rhizobium azibense]
MMTSQRRAAFSIFGATLLWSTAGLFMHMLATQTWTILFWRSLFGAIFVAGFTLLRGERVLIYETISIDRLGLVASVLSAAAMMAFISALRHTSVANVALIFATLPLVIALMSRLLIDEPLSARSAAACVGVFTGAVVIFWGSASASEAGLIGDMLAVVMTVTMALMAVALRLYQGRSVVGVVILSNLMTTVFAALMATSLTVSLRELAILACFGLFQMGVGLILFSVGARSLPSTQVALITTLEAPLSPLWVWLFFDDRPKIATVLGGALVLCTTTSYLLAEWRRPSGSGKQHEDAKRDGIR